MDSSKQYAKILELATRAGKEAFERAETIPMVVQQHANQLDDSSPVRKSYFVPEGPCGFAWVNLRPGTSGLARFVVRRKKGSKGYNGGVDISLYKIGAVPAQSQSYERKMAAAKAVARVLIENGFKAYPEGRMD